MPSYSRRVVVLDLEAPGGKRVVVENPVFSILEVISQYINFT